MKLAFYSVLGRPPVIVVVFMGTLNSSLGCNFHDNGQIFNGKDGCPFFTPVFDWITRCIIAIIAMFMVTFLPPFLQGKLNPVQTSCLL